MFIVLQGAHSILGSHFAIGGESACLRILRTLLLLSHVRQSIKFENDEKGVDGFLVLKPF